MSESSTRLPASAATEQSRRRRVPLILSVAALVLLVDQLTKTWAVNELESRTIHVVWTLQLNLTRNEGSAFSLDWGRFVPLLALLGVVAVLLLLRAGSGEDRLSALIGVGLAMGGALGNLADRAFREGDGFMGGAVIDFIDVQWWPVWNVADMGLVIGAALLVIGGLHETRRET